MNNTTTFNHEAIILYNKGTKCLQTAKYSKAVNFFKKSLAIEESADAWLNIGTAYKFLDLDDVCVKAFNKATSKTLYTMKTSHSVTALAYNNLGLMAYVRGKDTLALEYYDKAIEIWNNTKSNYNKDNKEFYDCLWNKATCKLRLMCSGEFDSWTEAWDLYENRFLKSAVVSVHPVFATIAHKIWMGQRDCKVVIAQEQGIGDNIMFARFIPQIEKQYNITCALQVKEELGSLLRENGINTPTLIDIREYDYMLPLGSICRYINYVDRAPYISTSKKIQLCPTELNIGVVWSGSKSHTNDRHRSCSSEYFKFLTKYGALWNLNPGCRNLPDWVNPLDLSDWQATATALNSLDLVITVDTSTAHLAGAMGIPTYLLQPRKETDFRWGETNTLENSTQNIWYDSVTVVTNPNDWSKCFENLKKELLK